MISALEIILRRPKVILAMMVLMVFAGVYSYLTIPKEARPDIQVPVFYVSIGLQGVSPEDAERLARQADGRGAAQPGRSQGVDRRCGSGPRIGHHRVRG